MDSNYPSHAPAPSLQAVLDYLWDGDTDQYVYRGQTQAYDTMVPSMLREARGSEEVPAGLISVDAIKWRSAQSSSRGRARADTIRYLIREFGWGLGNILAQQYGLASECIDVTSNPDVAGFFASRNYPDYDIVAPSSDQLGVIYRWPIRDFVWDATDDEQATLEWINTHLRWGYLHRYDPPLLFPHLVREADLDEAERKLFHERVFDAGPPSTAYLMTPPFCATHAFMAKVASQVSDTFGADFGVSRAAFQEGGLFRPSFVWECLVPNHITLENAYKSKIANPGIALGTRLVGVRDLMSLSGREAFYFRRTGQSPAFDREYLWPSVDTDRLLLKLALVAETFIAPSRAKHSILDWDHGILSPGYRAPPSKGNAGGAGPLPSGADA